MCGIIKVLQSVKNVYFLRNFNFFNPLTRKISLNLVILPTVCHTVLMKLVWRIWYWINL